MNTARSVAPRGRSANYRLLECWHYSDSAETVIGALQVLDLTAPDSVLPGTMAQKLSNLGEPI